MARTRHELAWNACCTVRPSSCGWPATSRAAKSMTFRSTGTAPRIWRPIMATAKEGAARWETERERVRAWGCAVRRVR